jgi:hypothetical protein
LYGTADSKAPDGKKWLSWPHCPEQKGQSIQVQHHHPDHASWPPSFVWSSVNKPPRCLEHHAQQRSALAVAWG